MIAWIRFESLFPKLKQLTFRRVIVRMMLHKSSEIYLEELHLAVEAEEFVVFQFVILWFEQFDYSIDNQVFLPPLALGWVSKSPNLPSYSFGLKGIYPEPVYKVSSPK